MLCIRSRYSSLSS